jgi:hypothetical protein
MNARKFGLPARHIAAAACMTLVLTTSAWCADRSAGQPGEWRFGSEVDLLPYINKGYYGSAFAGRDGWRFRVVAARSTMPSFLVKDGFRDKRSDAYAALVDRFFGNKKDRLEGFWIGGGVEDWRSRIRTESATSYAHYNNVMLTAGAGYVWKFSSHFYLNPWVAGHFAMGGARDIAVAGKTYTQPAFTPEASVKLGFMF